ncbi:hypothetical protein GW17_00013934 [Ensete ventricosum]|nr:hypothetical protein GW17_00013934 [Ensete ventricosum]
MAVGSDSSSMGFLGRHYEEVKEHWKNNFAFLDYYKKTFGRREPLPKWTDADVEEFIASDPVYGPQVSLGSLLPFLHFFFSPFSTERTDPLLDRYIPSGTIW